MAEPSSLRRNLLWTLTGDGTYAACQWAMLIVIAKLGTPVMVGQFALGLAITAPIIIFAGMSLRAVQATDARSEHTFGEYLALRLTTIMVALVVVASMTLGAGYYRETALVILWMALAKGLESVSDIYYGLLQRHERMDLIATSLLIKGPLSLAVLTAGLLLTGGLIWSIAALAVSWGLVLFLYDRSVGEMVLVRLGGGRHARPNWKPKRLWHLANVALPLGCTVMLVSLNLNIPRYFVAYYSGERQLGVFAALAHLLLAGNLIMNAFGQTASARLARDWADGRLQSFRHLLLKLVLLATVLGAAGIAGALTGGPQLLALFYQPEYAAQAGVFVWLMGVAAVGYVASALGYALTAARIFWLQPLQLGCATAAGAAACLQLVPSHGLLGAAWAMAISLGVQLAIAAAGLKVFLHQQARSMHKPYVAEVGAHVT